MFTFDVPAGPTRALIAWTYSAVGAPLGCDPATDTELVLGALDGTVLTSSDDAAPGVVCSRIDPLDPQHAAAAALVPGRYVLRVRQSPFAPPAATPYVVELGLQ